MDLYLVLPGIIAGLVATGAMTLFELPFWKKWGLAGVFEWHENQILASRLLRRDVKNLDLQGIFALHFINGGLGGLGLGLFLQIMPSFSSVPLLALGMAYGIFLWLLTLAPIHRPITGLCPWNHPLGKGPALASLAGHVLYGMVLSAFLSMPIFSG